MSETLTWRELPDFPMALSGELDDDRNPRKRLYSHPPPEGIGKTVSVEEGVRQIWDAVNAYLKEPKPEHILLIAAPPGSRKTSIGVELAEHFGLDDKKVIYCGPRHAHFDDIRKQYQQPDLWLPWMPKQKENEARNQPQTCKEADHQDVWVKKGWNAHDYCVGVCGWAYKDHECPWHGQGRKVKRMPGVIVYAQHNHIFTGLPVEKFDLMIVDECPKGAVGRIWKIPWQKIVPRHLPQESAFRAMLIRMRQMFADDKSVSLSGSTLIAALGGGEVVFDACEEVLPLKTSMQPDLRRDEDTLDDTKLDYAHIWELQALLKAEARQVLMGQDFPSRVSLHNGDLVLTLSKDVSDKVPPHVICLDATGNADLYQSIFDGRAVKVIAPQIAMQGKVIQVWTNTWSISSLYDFVKDEQEEKKEGEEERTDQDKEKKRKKNKDHWEKAKLVIEEAASRFGTVGFISYKGVVNELAPANATEIGWFGAERGTNRFVGEEGMIVFGTPMPPDFDIEATAKALYRHRMKSFKGKDGKLPFTKKRVPYQYVHEDGYGRAVDTYGYWTDPDLQAVLDQERESELFQALHRMRPLIQDKTVILMSNIPTPAWVEVQSIAEFFGTPIGADPYVWAKVKAFARERHDREGARITTKDLVESLDLDRRTIAKVMDGLLNTKTWRLPTKGERVLVADENGGRPINVIFPC